MNRFDVPEERWHDPDEHRRRLALAIRGLLQGRSNNVIDVTLDADSTSTAVVVGGVTSQTRAILTPVTATAAAASNLYIESTAGTLTIHHDSTPDTDRTFGLVYFG